MNKKSETAETKAPTMMFWSRQSVRLCSDGNLRECEKWMPKDEARQWCKQHGVLFVDTLRMVLAS